MQIVSGDNLHKMSKPILLEILENISKWRLLNFLKMLMAPTSKKQHS